MEPRPLIRAVEPKFRSAGRPPEKSLKFADGVRKVLGGAILWSTGHPEALLRLRRRVERSARRALTRLLNEPWKDSEAARIAKGLRHRQSMLFTFVLGPRVPWHNNEAESQVRQGVLFRKTRGGRRSWMGAWVLEQLLSVYRTCRKRGLEFLRVASDALHGVGYPAFGAPSSTPES
ncbi:MAG: transposase [Thermoplasmata archaeon]